MNLRNAIPCKKKGTGYFFLEKESCLCPGTVHTEKAACTVKRACPFFLLKKWLALGKSSLSPFLTMNY